MYNTLWKKNLGKKCGDYVWSKGFISLEIRGKKHQGGCSKEYYQVKSLSCKGYKFSENILFFCHITKLFHVLDL